MADDDGMGRTANIVFWSVIGLVALVAGIYIGINVLGLTGEGKAEKACKEAVERDLTAPASAEWSDVEVEGADDAYTVTGNVDADNSFGAKVRHTFTCETVGGEVRDHSVSGG